MKNRYHYYLLSFFTIVILTIACKTKDKREGIKTGISSVWQIDFLDNFDTFNTENWQDQRIWVNNETHCYVPDNEFGTREVSGGSLKLKVINIDKKLPCEMDCKIKVRQ